jgi:hypothetical protein
MIFDVVKASDHDTVEPERIEITSLEELIAFARQYYPDELIIDFDGSFIKIYDSYIE